jgi:hypothetical protein
MFKNIEELLAARIGVYPGEGAELGITDDEGHQWKVYQKEWKGNTWFEVYIGRALEWETPTFLKLDVWAKAKKMLGTDYEQKEALKVWSKAIHGF